VQAHFFTHHPSEILVNETISEAFKASIISPAQGAQQECMSNFFSPLGVCNLGRS
jgi:hypothetical protein